MPKRYARKKRTTRRKRTYRRRKGRIPGVSRYVKQTLTDIQPIQNSGVNIAFGYAWQQVGN